ncbi:MAG: GHKL domain-containing protein [Deltaproteobacteria bacterium]|nr:GHKL domain-containing protein [Deltaproteobacteria bacterium]
MKTSLYISLQRKMMFITSLVSLAPILILGGTIFYQFSQMYREKIEEQIEYRARTQAEALDLFLKERTAILAAMADTHSFQYMSEGKHLSEIFEVMNRRAGAFVDLGIIDSAGQHLAYVGPYDLVGLNYYQQPWFGEVVSKGIYISDVYLGYRRLPHFIIAVRRQENQNTWILRATIDPDIFGNIVRAGRAGKTGDAYIINKEGIFQTDRRFGSGILTSSDLDPSRFGSRTTIIEKRNGLGENRLYAGTWLENGKWLSVISQEITEEMSGLFATRNAVIAIIVCGILAIVATTFITTRLTLNRFREADKKLNELNAQLVQSDKLAALGKMAAGVAHEINNPLAVILQKTGWMEDLLTEEEFQGSKNLKEYITSVKKIEEHVDRARKVVHGMLGYARRMEPKLEDVDVNQVIVQTISLLDYVARLRNIRIQTELAQDMPVTASDQAQLQQVFFNLITNAIDAIEKDGWVRITTRKDDSNIQVDIEDNGPGMSDDIQKRVFDPFFTTKEPGKGTGLGLWVTYNIMEKMGGHVTVKSRKGEGTTFSVNIPMVVPQKK